MKDLAQVVLVTWVLAVLWEDLEDPVTWVVAVVFWVLVALLWVDQCLHGVDLEDRVVPHSTEDLMVQVPVDRGAALEDHHSVGQDHMERAVQCLLGEVQVGLVVLHLPGLNNQILLPSLRNRSVPGLNMMHQMERNIIIMLRLKKVSGRNHKLLLIIRNVWKLLNRLSKTALLLPPSLNSVQPPKSPSVRTPRRLRQPPKVWLPRELRRPQLLFCKSAA